MRKLVVECHQVNVKSNLVEECQNANGSSLVKRCDCLRKVAGIRALKPLETMDAPRIWRFRAQQKLPKACSETWCPVSPSKLFESAQIRCLHNRASLGL
ncbi:hypothetical protein V6N13_001695 [Hibiscus sabdariffa]|uniref:Uncharacterized protein n=1 Tax=Hibiscus sabdariffa TaxID=183260 RepID=A0ABR2G947_9ROSI